MGDRLTDDESVEFYRDRIKVLRDDGEYAGNVALWRLEKLLDTIDRQRDTLNQIRDIVDPDTDTMVAPMEAIRNVLEEVND